MQAKTFKTLSPTVDVVFHYIFTHPANRDILVSLLSAVLESTSKIVKVRFRNPAVAKEEVAQKGIILDMLVTLEDGRRIIIEMQARMHPNFRERVIVYVCRTYTAQLLRGGKYTALKPVEAIVFANFIDAEKRRLHSMFELREVLDHHRFSDAVRVHFISLPLARRMKEAPASGSDLWCWAMFLTGRNDAERRRAAQNHPMVAKAFEFLKTISADPEVREMVSDMEFKRRAYEAKMAMDRQAAVAEAEARGIAKGEAKGEARGIAKGEARGIAKGEARGIAKGIAKGEAKAARELKQALLDTLFSKDIPLPDPTRSRIERCKDSTQLGLWFRRALALQPGDDLFAV